MEDFVNKNLIYKTIVGSKAYGIDTPESDTDIKGITIAPKEYYFGLKVFEQQEIGKDCTIYALNKFVRLARDNNPNILEMLYTEPRHILFINKYGEMLRENRGLFLSKKAKFSFSGYGFAQLLRIKNHRKWIMFKEKEPVEEDFWVTKYRTMPDGTTKAYEKFQEQEYENAKKKWNQYLDWKKNRNPERAKLEEKYLVDTKHACHLFRLMTMCKEILTDGKVIVYRPDRDKLLAIRNGEWLYEKIVEEAEKLEKELDELYEKSTLQHRPNDKAIDKLLIDITEQFFEENK